MVNLNIYSVILNIQEAEAIEAWDWTDTLKDLPELQEVKSNKYWEFIDQLKIFLNTQCVQVLWWIWDYNSVLCRCYQSLHSTGDKWYMCMKVINF